MPKLLALAELSCADIGYVKPIGRGGLNAEYDELLVDIIYEWLTRRGFHTLAGRTAKMILCLFCQGLRNCIMLLTNGAQQAHLLAYADSDGCQQTTFFMMHLYEVPVDPLEQRRYKDSGRNVFPFSYQAHQHQLYDKVRRSLCRYSGSLSLLRQPDCSSAY